MARLNKFTGSLSAISVTAGILAAILGGWLTGHWLWAPACGLLVLIGIAAGSEALKARREAERENRNEAEPSGAPHIGDNARVGRSIIAGHDIDQSITFSPVYRSRITVIGGVGGIAGIIALVTLAAAFVGTALISLQTKSITLESPQNLAAEGNHTSPDAAAKGMIGDYLLGDYGGMCNYLLPDEQQTCLNQVIPQSTAQPLTIPPGASLGTGRPIISGTLALVPVVARSCSSGKCQTRGNNGLPAGSSFQADYQQAMNSQDSGNLIPCEEVNGTWYVSAPPSVFSNNSGTLGSSS